MKSLKVIDGLVVLAGGLLFLVALLFIIIVATTPQDTFLDVGSPQWKITADNIENNLERTLHESLKPQLPVSEEPVLLKVDQLSMSLPMKLSIKIFLIGLILIVAIYIMYIIRVIRKIISDVKKNSPFNMDNTKRVKRIGLLVTVAPLIEWVSMWFYSVWMSNIYHFEGIELDTKPSLGWPVLVLGLLIMALGVAFEQGQKIQEENQLTI